MALLKDQINEQGVCTKYHRISVVSLNNGILLCRLNSYVSKDYRELEKPAKITNFHFPITVEEEESMGIRQLAYKKIKAHKEWIDAEDC